jgi:uridine kinase
MSLITIDGPAGSGKTTLAAQIEDSLRRDGVNVLTLHMDDLYEGWELALSYSLTQNLQRILEEFSAGKELVVPQFDWESNRYSQPKIYPSPTLLILEGVGSGQRVTRTYASIALWVEAPADIALARVLQRDGDEIAPQMVKWQSDENHHFLEEGTRSAADYCVKSAP